MPDQNEFIHPGSPEIGRFIDELRLRDLPLNGVAGELFRWFDGNVSYSRLNAPYHPLQRSDLDVLRMRSGTCGDYANLVVSVLTRLGYETGYAYVHADCYGDPQDHICAAVRGGERVRLIDATLPYRKWHGFDCPHKEYELLSCGEMKDRWMREQRYWTDRAIEWKREPFAGLLYAPWIHEEIVLNTEDSLETVFFLLMLDGAHAYTVHVYYLVYSETEASAAILCTATRDAIRFRFPVNAADGLWDENRWGEGYAGESIPERYRSDRLSGMLERIDRILPLIRKTAEP